MNYSTHTSPKAVLTADMTSPIKHDSSKNSPLLKSSLMTSNAFPNFIRPSINPASGCNLWGPLCQTGLIEVDVITANSTTKTTVPCSYYLSAQTKSAGTFYPNLDYLRSFGHSPECASYADALQAQHGPGAPEWGYPLTLTFPNCPPPLQSYSPYSPFTPFVDQAQYLPPGVSNHQREFGAGASDFYCCGQCTFSIPEVRLLYFAPTTYDCSTTYNRTVSTPVSSSKLKLIQNRAHSFLSAASTFVSDGYTLLVMNLMSFPLRN